jgi:pyrimidine-specific ribonucleoside hydrolase
MNVAGGGERLPTMGARVGVALLLATAGLAVAAASGCGLSGGGQSAALPVVVDTDLSSDDVIALLYLLRNPAVDVRAVTVAGTGLVHCPVGARNAAELLALAGRRDVPVACGSGLPLEGLNAPPEDWRRAADDLFGLALPPARTRASGTAVELLRREAPGTTVLELAPMTNLAGALRAEPELTRRIHAVVAMAGAVSVPGNVDAQPSAETNAWIDPAALRAVLRSGVPLTLVPLDATNQVPVTPYVGETLKRYHYATAEATAVWDLVAGTRMADGGTYFWDPLAATALVDPAVLRTETLRIDVETTGTDEGRTVSSPGGERTTVATGANRIRFERDLLDTLLVGAPYTISRKPTATVTWDGERCSYSGPRSLSAGAIAVDVVDGADEPFQYAIFEVQPPHTLADVQAYVAGLTGAPTSPPGWISGQASGAAQPRSDVTWVASVSSGASGSVAVACVLNTPPYAIVATTLPVYAG